jgi:hypothetical protein
MHVQSVCLTSLINHVKIYILICSLFEGLRLAHDCLS